MTVATGIAQGIAGQGKQKRTTVEQPGVVFLLVLLEGKCCRALSVLSAWGVAVGSLERTSAIHRHPCSDCPLAACEVEYIV